MIDHYEFTCRRINVSILWLRLRHRWVDKIQVWTKFDRGNAGATPADRPRLEPYAALMAAKLSVDCCKTTNLRSHDEPTFRREGKSTVYNETRSVKNEWAVVYGRVVKNADLDKNCHVEGCGGDNVPLTIVVKALQHLCRRRRSVLCGRQRINSGAPKRAD